MDKAGWMDFRLVTGDVFYRITDSGQKQYVLSAEKTHELFHENILRIAMAL